MAMMGMNPNMPNMVGPTSALPAGMQPQASQLKMWGMENQLAPPPAQAVQQQQNTMIPQNPMQGPEYEPNFPLGRNSGMYSPNARYKWLDWRNPLSFMGDMGG